MTVEKLGAALSVEQLTSLMQKMGEFGVKRLEFTSAGGERIVLRQAEEHSGLHRPVTKTAPVKLRPSTQQICATMHGVFYLAASPGEAPFVTAGVNLKEGAVIGVLEAMKTLTRIEAEYDCRVLEVLVKDGATVAPGTPLFQVEKDDA
ncbi:biotin carboxyl carrier protein of acetyl-CoA carboxylase [Neokomagataea thailandica NBRC 106555]|uniref:Biotin carboxyl carrier protein of acetyl-CoA carboxylase n=2 Tax=Neokomagataea TaxID=1223423 RepID=A0A4Y6V5P9_9PROT|nr:MULTISPECIES: biotin/lipoyl-containing protein [Neokomagataea]QDH25253.1 acetyl-CoA carboxylase biotin carboxyl carrier protein subunit [Neokomagataea tanensis]GBR54300.1 biotin carboxyl carrier protein of acetyl-CoA carboxylase [Neokomagataea thailandica NBRC 106555]